MVDSAGFFASGNGFCRVAEIAEGHALIGERIGEKKLRALNLGLGSSAGSGVINTTIVTQSTSSGCLGHIDAGIFAHGRRQLAQDIDGCESVFAISGGGLRSNQLQAVVEVIGKEIEERA